MKNPNFKVLIIALFALGLTLTSCGSQSNNAGQTDQTENQGKEYTSAYICPMHCEGSGSDQPGKCPSCGMEYVKNDGNKHDDHDHHGHSH